MKSGEKTEELPIETDFGTWAGEEKRRLEVHLEPEIAELYLKLRRKKTERRSVSRMKEAETVSFSEACIFLKTEIQENERRYLRRKDHGR